MKKLSSTIKWVLPLLMVALLSGGCLINRVVRYPGGVDVPVKQLPDELRKARAVFIGEYHEDWSHHRIQLKVIKGLHRAGVKLAIGLEMFRADSQDALDRWVAGEMTEKAFRKEYHNNWSVSWYKYSGILKYAKKNHIPLVGLNVPRGVAHKVFTGKIDSLEQDDRAMIGDITCDVDKRYEKLIKDAIKDHKGMKTGFNNFCEVQMVWDNFMASRVVNYLKANPYTTMVVLSGSAHSWKRGIPRKISAMSDLPTLVVLPEASDGFGRVEVTSGDTDYLWLDP